MAGGEHGSRGDGVVGRTAAEPVVLGDGEPQGVDRHGSVVVRTSPDPELWLVRDGVTRSLPSDSTPCPTAEVVALTDDDIAYGRWNSTPVRWDCRLPCRSVQSPPAR
ncbi:hypothetical protein [Streptomyces echinatus]|uniref:Uncharacterized protein n=1 Tax=Streptomyces echinatus TaxID=67293 RepID=A0A7W9Q3D4_9ACTN|nr:hypothetical protein [Streptomyces echinatus]MBB5932398.1 hypothetical protein [Streptomyces echinatus]